MPAGAQGRPQVAGQSAHIGSGRALDDHVEIEDLDAVDIRRPAFAHLEAADPHGPRGQGHLLPGPDPGVRTHPVDLDRRHRGGHLLEVPGQGGNRRIHPILVQVCCAGRSEHLALRVVGPGGHAQPDRRRVRLVVQGQQPE